MDARDNASGRGTLIVLSNRLPYAVAGPRGGGPARRNVGGLVSALEPVLAARRGCWIGWDGAALPSSTAVAAQLARTRPVRGDRGIELHGVPLSERELTRFYHGFSNRTLWPLFHDLVDKTIFNAEDFAAYRRVNRRFAEAALARAGEQDRIWIHDYHLMLVPRLLRELGFAGRIDFFLHVPFPAPETFGCLPWRDVILEGLLSADSLAFHVPDYRDNFAHAVERFLAARVVVERTEARLAVGHEGGTTRLVVAPIGIAYDEFERLAASPGVGSKLDALRRTLGARQLIFGADRLDYTKGITQRLLAVERLLKRYPERAGTFTMMQVVVPSRSQLSEYRTMKREIDQHVGRINGEHGREPWIPIHYEYRALDRQDLVAHYRAASVALVTPLRDGMNLVAPEFVASRIDEDGVLVLSEFAGVAERLPEALRVNPYDLDGCAEAILRALDMPRLERTVRMRGLRRRVRENTGTVWARRCLELGVEREALPATAAPASCRTASGRGIGAAGGRDLVERR